MSNKKIFWITFLKRTILAIASILLLSPIITLFIPLNEFESASGMEWFLVATSVVALLLPFWYAWIPVQVGVILFTYQNYFPVSETGLDWFRVNFEQLSRTTGYFLQGELAVFPTNTALLLILLLVSGASYLMINKSKPSYLVLTCLIYLMILHVFTQYDFFPFVVQVLAISVFLFGISQVPVDKGWRQAILSFFVVAVTGFLFTRIAIFGSENFADERQWVEFKTRTYQRQLDEAGVFDFVDFYSSGGGLRRMGYDEDDSELGGPVQQNFDPVFNAYSDSGHYWRLSTKILYTGRGWENEPEPYSIPADYYFGLASENQPAVETIVIELDDAFDYYPLTYNTVGTDLPEGLFNYNLDYNSLSYVGGNDLSDYNISVAAPQYTEELLNDVVVTDEDISLLTEYLAVPDTIPDRVWELALEITEGSETMYDKVRAIEEYLRSGAGLRYSLREASRLPEGEDYVDHFLFETLVGYCDNFSTAMVILSRMNGIPTRWAKGFNSGVLTEDEDGTIYYEITNGNAHSWPEVLFGDYGWIPFEPTPAFHQPLTNDIRLDDVGDNDTDGEPIWEEGQEPEVITPQESVDDVVTPEDEPVLPEEEVVDEAEAAPNYWPEVGAVALILGTLLVYLGRRILYPYVVMWLLKLPFLNVRAKSSLILSLFKLDRHKESHETFRQYFTAISQQLPLHRQTIMDFVGLNESMLYAPQAELNLAEAQVILAKMTPVYQDLQLAKKKSSF